MPCNLTVIIFSFYSDKKGFVLCINMYLYWWKYQYINMYRGECSPTGTSQLLKLISSWVRTDGSGNLHSVISLIEADLILLLCHTFPMPNKILQNHFFSSNGQCETLARSTAKSVFFEILKFRLKFLLANELTNKTKSSEKLILKQKLWS